ncbi:hypothetical protein [Streptomyces nogalater]|uniref:Uncharacterized protein n=1 Tax=Streptomyces nogalater TaxID=38314 RepID=A0ABW0W8C3_STRNO
MPATAHQPESDGDSLAPVVSLAGRRGAQPGTADPAALPGATVEGQLAAEAVRHWTGVFRNAGLDLGDEATVATVSVVAKELERLTSGLLVLREGQGHLPPDPDAGVDFTSAVQMTGLFRDLVHAAEEAAKAKR